MKRGSILKVALIGTGIVGLSLGAVASLTDPAPATLPLRAWSWLTISSSRWISALPLGWRTVSEETVPLFSDFVFDNSGLEFASAFSAPVHDPSSLTQIRDSVLGRAQRGIRFMDSKLAGLKPDDSTTPYRRMQTQMAIGALLMYDGKWHQAGARFAAAQDADPTMPATLRANLDAPARARRAQARRDRKLRGLLQRVELYLSSGRRGRPSTDIRLEGGDRALQSLPGTEAGRPRGPVAVEHRLYDTG